MASADIGVDVTALGLAERPRSVPVGVLFAGVGVIFSSLASSLDGVEARESLSLLPVLVPSGFFGFGVAAVYYREEKWVNKKKTTINQSWRIVYISN